MCRRVQACAKYTHVEVMYYNSTIYLNAHHFEYDSNPASMWHQCTIQCGLLYYIIVKLISQLKQLILLQILKYPTSSANVYIYKEFNINTALTRHQ
jgi:hypothetical protein